MLATSQHIVQVTDSQLHLFFDDSAAAELSASAADLHIVCAGGVDSISGSCSIWWSKTAQLQSARTGYIGNFNADSLASSQLLLNQAIRALSEQGCTIAIGPMNGSTWRNHRLIIERGSEPSFFLETTHPEEYPSYFRASGFSTCATYTSAKNTAPELRDPMAKELGERLHEKNVSTDAFDLSKAEEELGAMYSLCSQSFTKNFLYTPISRDDFLSLYKRLIPIIDPDLIVVLRRNSELVGFCFAVPNLGTSTERETAIIKTIVRNPGKEFAGAGRYMLDCAHARAYKQGFRSAIHAFYKSDNVSGKLSELTSKPIRTYALFAKDINQ